MNGQNIVNCKSINSTHEYSKKRDHQKKQRKHNSVTKQQVKNKIFLTKTRSLSSCNSRCSHFSQVDDSCSVIHRNCNSSKIKKERMKTFKEFLLNLPNNVTSLDAKFRYEKYKEQLNYSMESIFYDEHKNEEWFLERYNPFFLQENINNRTKYAQKESKVFVEEYLSGKLKHLLSEDFLSSNKKNSEKYSKTKKKYTIEEKTKRKLFSKNSILLKNRKLNEFHGPQSNQLMGYTLGKNNVLNKKFFDNSIFIQGIPLTISRAKLLNIFQEVVGFESLILSDPVKGPRKIQYGWAKFKTKQILEEVILDETQGGLNGKKVFGAFYLNIFPKSSLNTKRRKPVLKNIFSSPKRLKHDLKQAFKLIIHLDKVNKVYSHKLFESIEFSSLITDVQRINIAIEYLRRIHLLCYYQAHYFLTKEHLLNKFPISFVRKRFEPSRRIIYQSMFL